MQGKTPPTPTRPQISTCFWLPPAEPLWSPAAFLGVIKVLDSRMSHWWGQTKSVRRSSGSRGQRSKRFPTTCSASWYKREMFYHRFVCSLVARVICRWGAPGSTNKGGVRRRRCRGQEGRRGWMKPRGGPRWRRWRATVIGFLKPA